MKHSFALLVFVLLSACIYIDDIGAYWDKGIVDEALAGKWEQQKAAEPEIRDITLVSGEYRIEALDAKSKDAKNYRPVLARTLKLGAYSFFMVDPKMPGAKPGSNSSDLWRYTLEAGKLTLYTLRPQGLGPWLNKNYPGGQKITVDGTKGVKDGLYVNIAQLDDKVAGMLASIPDKEAFWAKGKVYAIVKPKP